VVHVLKFRGGARAGADDPGRGGRVAPDGAKIARAAPGARRRPAPTCAVLPGREDRRSSGPARRESARTSPATGARSRMRCDHVCLLRLTGHPPRLPACAGDLGAPGPVVDKKSLPANPFADERQHAPRKGDRATPKVREVCPAFRRFFENPPPGHARHGASRCPRSVGDLAHTRAMCARGIDDCRRYGAAVLTRSMERLPARPRRAPRVPNSPSSTSTSEPTPHGEARGDSVGPNHRSAPANSEVRRRPEPPNL
jgi:hypothetical protein